ncbi:MAG: cytochrome-c oxidase, partial [Gammaproteobacteria bacterium]|nr:cytochrome-c oxidase [Gammaproteobacteria bacterium]
MVLAVVLALLVIGSVIFHFWSPWWFTPVASNWGSIDDTVEITFWITGIVFVAINLFMAYAVFRYRKKKGSKA